MTSHIFVPIPRHNLDFQHHNAMVFFVLSVRLFVLLILVELVTITI